MPSVSCSGIYWKRATEPGWEHELLHAFAGSLPEPPAAPPDPGVARPGARSAGGSLEFSQCAVMAATTILAMSGKEIQRTPSPITRSTSPKAAVDAVRNAISFGKCSPSPQVGIAEPRNRVFEVG